MEFNFVKFKSGASARGESTISLNKPNSIGFSSRFYQDNIVNEFKYAVLFFDTDKLAVGIKLTNSEEESDKYSIVHSKKGFGGTIIPKSFFKMNNITLEKYAGRYEWSKEKIDGVGDIFVILLKDKTAESI